MKFLENQKSVVDAELEEVLPDYPEPTKLPYVIEGLLPANQVHLIGGPSGGGKTTLSFQMLHALTTGADFLGRRTIPVKLAYVSGDRATASVKETQERCGVDFPVFSLVDENLVGEDLATKIIPRLTAVYGYRPNFIYVDGFTSLVPGGFLNNYAIVARWLAALQRYCWRMQITLVGACHTTKTKEGEKFLNPRQRIAGSVAWAGFSESVIIIEPVEDDPKGDKRIVHLLPRNHQGENMILKFNTEGKLEMPEKILHQESVAEFVLEGLLEAYPIGTQVIYAKLKEAAMNRGIAQRTFDRWLASWVEQGKLVRQKKGMYVISKPPQSSSDSDLSAEAPTPTIQ